LAEFQPKELASGISSPKLCRDFSVPLPISSTRTDSSSPFMLNNFRISDGGI
jgi:hypothetical protein